MKVFIGSLPEHVDEKLFVDGERASLQQCLHADCIKNFHLLIKGHEEDDVREFVQNWIHAHPHGMIQLNEVGSGIVPIKKEDRQWRDMVGKIGSLLTKNAEEVYRTYFGITTKIKGQGRTRV